MFKILGKIFLLPTLIICPFSQLTADPSTADFSFLEGTWSFSDSSVSGNYKEDGIRVCEFILAGDYMQCKSVGTDDRENTRTYYFFFNYNSFDEQYEMVGLTEGYSRKTEYILSKEEGSKNWSLISPPGRESRKGTKNWSTWEISDDEKTWIWTIRLNKPGNKPDEWPVSFIDTATRIEE